MNFVAVAALLAGGVTAFAEDRPDTPTQLAGGKVITVAEAQALLGTGRAVFIDTRSPLNFGKGRVPGARLAYYNEKSAYAPDFDGTVDSFDWERLPADKSVPVVFYSHGSNGWKSYKAAVLAVGRGYRQVLYLRDGWTGWQAAQLPVEQ
ncbi:MAG TPA: rhodanese-like domain-containing protein [Methylibium sp.]|nr:rhodanese-like domain-containing protein [Methylibium sp.]